MAVAKKIRVASAAPELPNSTRENSATDSPVRTAYRLITELTRP